MTKILWDKMDKHDKTHWWMSFGGLVIVLLTSIVYMAGGGEGWWEISSILKTALVVISFVTLIIYSTFAWLMETRLNKPTKGK